MKKISIALLLAFIYQILLAKQGFLMPVNLDFDLSTPGQPPFGWTLTGNSIDLGYYCITSTENPYSGRYCLEFGKTEKTEIDNWGAVYQKIDVRNLTGRKFVFSVYARAEITEKTSHGSIIASVNSSDNKLIYTKTNESTPIKSNKWQMYVVEGELGSDAYELNIGFVLKGIGKLWFDKVDITFIDEKEPNFQPPRKLTTQQIKNIQKFFELYGYIRYFHPSSETQNIDWNSFLVNGVKAVENCPTDNDLYKKLYDVYIPIAPALRFINLQDKDTNFIFRSNNIIKDVLLSYLHRGACTYYDHNFFSTNIVNTKLPQRESEALAKQIINVEKLRNRKILITAYTRIEKNDDISNTQLWIRLEDANNEFLKLITTENQKVKSSQWEEVRVSFTLPEQVSYIWIGLALEGEGVAYFDKVQLLAEKGSADKKSYDTIAIVNGDFEEGYRSDVILGWKLDNESVKAGYTAMISSEKPLSGKKCLKIFSDERTKIIVPQENDFVILKISPDLIIEVPIVLQVDKDGTLPRYKKEYDAKKQNISLNENNFYHRIAIVGYLWNFFKHFSLTLPESENWEKVLYESLEKIQNVQTEREFIELLNYICYKTKDPLANVWKGTLPVYYNYPFLWKKIEDFVFVTKTLPSLKEISPGDIILEINSKSIYDLIAQESEKINFTNEDFKVARALARIRSSENKTFDTLLVQKPNGRTQKVIVQKSVLIDELETKSYPPIFKFEGKNYVYVDLTRADEFQIKNYLNTLSKADVVVFDLRGEVFISEHFLGFLTDKPINFVEWIVPVFAFPDRQKQSRKYVSSTINPKNPKFTGKAVFLCNEASQTYSEAILEVVKYNGLGTVIGKETANVPYEIFSFNIPGNYTLSFSSMYRLDIYGQNMSRSPIVPDIKIKEYSDQYIRYSDYLLEKAIEELSK